MAGRIKRSWLSTCGGLILVLAVVLAAYAAWSQDDGYLGGYTGSGADFAGDENCLMCHPDKDPGDEYGHASVFMDEDHPIYGSGCEACHGPGGNHNGVAEGIIHQGKLPVRNITLLCKNY